MGGELRGGERSEPVELVSGLERLVPVVLRNESPDAFAVALPDRAGPPLDIEADGSRRTFMKLRGVSGRNSLSLPFEAGGKQLELEVPVEVRESARHRFRVEDELGRSTPTRLYVEAADGRSYAPEGARQRRNVDGEIYYYVPGEFEIVLPEGAVELEFVKGFEYRASRVQLDPPGPDAAESEPKRVEMERWIDMPSRGWFSGDGHVHMNYNPSWPAILPEDAFLMQQAEDLNLANMMVANVNGDDVRDADRFEGRPHALSLPRHQMRWNEEYRNPLLGHLVFYGLESLTTPIYGGFRDTPNPYAVPLNADIADQVLAQGGYVTGPHAAWGKKEHAIDVGLGKMEGLEVMGYGVLTSYGVQALRRFWNTGFRLVATAGTDAVLNSPYGDPVGGARCYVHVEGDFSVESWLSALRAGRSFVSNGPVVLLEVDGQEPGSEIRFDGASREPLKIRVEAVSQWPLEELAVFFNGQVIAATREADEQLELETTFLPPDSGWIAARVRGPANRLVFGGGMARDEPQFAHTSAVWVVVDGKPQPPSADAEALVEWTDAFTREVERSGHFESQEQREHMRAVYGEARARFEALADEYRGLAQ